jgi:photosystem II stability/assembly factor-like uncharacterized protein
MRKIPLAFILLATVFQSGLLAHQPHDPMAVIAASPNFANDKIVLAATSYLTVSIGVYLPLLSTDGGVSWTPLEGFPNLAITAIRFSPSFSTDGTAFMSGGGGLFRSSNMGSNWSQISVGGGHPILDMAISPNFLNDGTMFAISTAGLYESTDHGNTFETLSAPVSSAWFSVCAISTNFTADHIFTIGDDQGNIFETTNGGALWTNLTAGLGLAPISRIIFTPAFSAYPIILVGTNGTGVYASQDAGSTWSATNSGITDLNVTDLALYPDYTSLGTALITTKSAGVFISKNRGRAWTLTSLPNRPLSPQTQTHFVTLAPATTSANTAIVFLGMFEGTWTTTNQGTSWTYVDILPTWLVRHLQISSTYPADKSLFATTYGGGNLFTGSGGNTWGFLNTGFSNVYPDPGAFSPNFDVDHILFSGIVTGLDRTTNQGATWTTVPALGVSNYPRALAVSPNFAVDNTVLIGVSNGESGNPATVVYKGVTYYNEGLFLSTNGGLNWIPTSLNGPAVYAIALSPNFANDQTAYAGTSGQGTFKSVDGGNTWTQTFTLPTDQQVLALAISPSYASDQTAFVATSHSGVYKTVNGGGQWTQLTATSGFSALCFAISPNFAVDQTLFIGTFESGLLETRDGGNSFQTVNLDHNFVMSLAISPGFATDQTIFAATYRGIFVSKNAGKSWAFAMEPNRMESDRIETVLLTGTWTKTYDPSASGSSFSQTNTPGASATINFYGSGINWISPIGPKGDSPTISIDGGAATAVSEKSATFTEQQTVYQNTGLACGEHTAVITASAQAGTLITYLDAFDISRAACSF